MTENSAPAFPGPRERSDDGTASERDRVVSVLRGLCAHVMSVPPSAVEPQARLVADLGADSLDLTELEAAVTDAFGVLPDRQEMRRVATVGDVADLVVALRGPARAGEAPA
jgi:acyl carrier protein